MFDSESYFVDHGSFPEIVNADTQLNRLISEHIDRAWDTYDKNKNGALDKDETHVLLDEILSKYLGNKKVQLNDEEFENLFKQFDANHNGRIEKVEMAHFIKNMLQKGIK